MVQGLNISFSRLADKNALDKVIANAVETPEVESVFVTGAHGKSLEDILAFFFDDFFGHDNNQKVKIDANSDLMKELKKLKENKDSNGTFQIPSVEKDPNGNLRFAIGNKLFNAAGKEYDWKKHEKERFSTANGKIDNPFNQGNEGDCWLLTPVNAEKEQINKTNIINKQKDGSFIVTIRNPENPKEIHKIGVTVNDFTDIKNRNLSSGDPDAKIIEIATKKLYKQLYGDSSIDGDNESNAYIMLTGKSPTTIESDNSPPISPLTQLYKRFMYKYKVGKMLDKIGKSGIPATAGTLTADAPSFTGRTSVIGKLKDEHAYTIVKVDPVNKVIEMKDPNDTSKIITITYDEFLNNFNQLTIAN